MLRIFVSSTFNDMHMERDCLENIQQDLNAKLIEIGEKIEFVDLRWGICTEELDEEDKNKAVLEGCFSAIDKSDYLLVFLGNRYGTLKSYNEVLGYLGKKKTDILLKTDDAGMSVTELEVTYAQLVKGFDSKNTIVCIRDESNVEKKEQRFIDGFVKNSDYEKSILHYSNSGFIDFKHKLKTQLGQIIEEHMAQSTGFDKDRKRLENLAIDAILNEQMSSLKIEKQVIIFSGASGIEKTTTAAEILVGNFGKKLLPFVTWGAKEKKLNYEQIIDLLIERFGEWFNENPEKNNINAYIKKCISRISDDGYEFVIFLDAEENISSINYGQLLDFLGNGHLFICTLNYGSVLSKIPFFSNYKVIDEEDLLFSKNEIENVIRSEFYEHGKNIRTEIIDILTQKDDILKPLYLHYAVNRLLFLKAYDFDKCGQNESPEVKVLSDIAEKLPGSLDELLAYCVKNVSDNSGISSQMEMVIALLSESYKGVNDNVIIDYFIYKGQGTSRADILPYVYEIKNRLADFIMSDGLWCVPKYNKKVYNWVKQKYDVASFVENRKKHYRDEYIIREYMYWNCENANKIYSFLSARTLWKFENSSIRKMYRETFWDLVEKGYIKEELLDKKIFWEVFNKYENTDEYYTGQICTRNPVFRLLSEEIENERFNYQEGDGIVFLLRIAEVYIEELKWIHNSAILTCLNDIPMDVLSIFEKLSYVYKTFSKTLLKTSCSEWDLKKLYETLVEETIDNSGLINSLSCAEVLIDETDNRSVTYYHNAVRLLSAADFMVNLGIYDKRFYVDEHIYGNGIYFNWKYKSDKVFDTVKYMLMYTLSNWVVDFSDEGSQVAMDIVAVDYYLNYSNRIELMSQYNDAIMLLLIWAYEVCKRSHFRKYNDGIENYWINHYPYTRLECCSRPEEVNGDDYEIRRTVVQTTELLAITFKKVYSSEDIGLKEKCMLDILKTEVLKLVLSFGMNEKHAMELVYPLIDLFKEANYLTEVLKNDDLHDYLPIDYALDNTEDVIRQAVKELNFNCI